MVARLAPGFTQAQAYAEVTTLTDARAIALAGDAPAPAAAGAGLRRAVARRRRAAWSSPATHLPILLVMLVACVNVGTLVYARTATRDAEIAMRFALGASRARIVSQLFVEALVLSAVAAAVGLTVAHFTLKWATHAFNSGDTGGLPFWVRSRPEADDDPRSPPR